MALSSVPPFSKVKAYPYLAINGRPGLGGDGRRTLSLSTRGRFFASSWPAAGISENAAADTWSGGLPHLKYRRGRPSLVALSLNSKEGFPCPFLVPTTVVRHSTRPSPRFFRPRACPSPTC